MHKIIKKTKGSPGVTLAEVAVIIFIIALFSTITAADFPKIKRQYALSKATYKFAQDLRRVEDAAMSGASVCCVAGQPVKTGFSGVDAFGMHVESSQPYYTIYAYAASGGSFLQSGTVEDINIEELYPDVYIKQILNLGSGSSSFDVVFAPPSPKVYIQNMASGQNSVKVVFCLKVDNAACKTVSVNSAGLINIE